MPKLPHPERLLLDSPTQAEINAAWAEKHLSDCRQLTRSGNEWRMCSPLRKDMHPSFNVNIEKGTFNDFGDETAHGTLTELATLLGVPAPEYAGAGSNPRVSLTAADPKGEPAADAEREEREREAVAIYERARDRYHAIEWAEHPYLAEKGLKGLELPSVAWLCPDMDTPDAMPYSGKEVRPCGQMLVPVRDLRTGKVQGIEAILREPVDGVRKLAYGSKGGIWTCGNDRDPKAPIVLCEGFATAATVGMILKPDACAVCCFGLSNMESIARALHEKHPLREIAFAADTGGKSQAIFKKLTEPAQTGKRERGRPRKDEPEPPQPVPMICAIPYDYINGEKLEDNSDWNDIYLRFGVDIAKRELETPFRVSAIMEEVRASTGQTGKRSYADYMAESYTLEELSAREFTPQPQPCKNLIHRGLTILAGKAKQGKSWLALQAAECISQGAPLLGLPTVKSPVFYLALEDTAERIKSRGEILSITTGYPLDALKDVRIFHSTQPLTIGNPNTENFCEMLWRAGGAVVFVDVWSKAKGDDFSSLDAYNRDYRQLTTLKTIADRTGSAIVLITHMNKYAPAFYSDFDKINGSAGMSGASDGLLLLTTTEGTGTPVLRRDGRDYDDTDDIPLEWTKPAGWRAMDRDRYAKLIAAAQQKDSGELSGSMAEVLDVIDSDPAREWTAEALCSYLDGVKPSTVKKCIQRLYDAGDIEKVSRGKYKSIDAPEEEPEEADSLTPSQPQGESEGAPVSSDPDPDAPTPAPMKDIDPDADGQEVTQATPPDPQPEEVTQASPLDPQPESVAPIGESDPQPETPPDPQPWTKEEFF